jgi:hypothetical protein
MPTSIAAGVATVFGGIPQLTYHLPEIGETG